MIYTVHNFGVVHTCWFGLATRVFYDGIPNISAGLAFKQYVSSNCLLCTYPRCFQPRLSQGPLTGGRKLVNQRSATGHHEITASKCNQLDTQLCNGAGAGSAYPNHSLHQQLLLLPALIPLNFCNFLRLCVLLSLTSVLGLQKELVSSASCLTPQLCLEERPTGRLRMKICLLLNILKSCGSSPWTLACCPPPH